ncbi:Guanylate kinase [Dictyocoela muelleri]|nr:Guanylate kinase [Dictyocoela muelleri]
MTKIIVSGTSGAGKTTLIKKFIDEFPQYHLSISCTTRKSRINEQDGKDYYFITKDQFLNKIKNNEFVEYVEYNNEFYGTLKKEILKHNIIIDVERNGVIAIKNIQERMKKDNNKDYNNDENFIYIFVYSDYETIRKRLLEREKYNTDNSEEKIDSRLKSYHKDKELFDNTFYDIGIYNQNLELAYEEFKNFIIKNK